MRCCDYLERHLELMPRRQLHSLGERLQLAIQAAHDGERFHRCVARLERFDPQSGAAGDVFR